MPNWNNSFPEVLGNEWLANIGASSRVWSGAPAAMARYQSTAAETITALKMSATVNHLLEESVPTLVDVIEEGNEETTTFAPVALLPNSDITINGWRTETGALTNLYTAINEDSGRWPGPASTTYLRNYNSDLDEALPDEIYECSVDAAAFDVAGALVNSRIGFVTVRAIYGANTGFRKLGTSLVIGGNSYHPAGGALRDVHGYGAIYSLWWGELNPATSKPWTPADIAQFKIGGTSKIRVRTHAATAVHFPKIFALSLIVYHIPVENRAAVGVWRRPETLTSRLTNVTTDSLITVPSGAANWSKLSARNYLFYWRQSASPASYGAVVADDVRWNYARQNLGPVGQPPGYAAPPGGILAALGIPYDQFGRPAEGFVATPGLSATSAAGLAMVRSDAAISIDSQPYRLDITDLAFVTSTQKLGQRVTPTSTNSYLGVRLTVIPPASGNPTLTVAVVRVSDSVQMGGTLTITATAARALPDYHGWRYVTGFLASSATLTSGIAYEIRVTTTAGGSWTMAMPDSSLGETASFGGSTNGAFIGATHITTRDLSINLVKQPNPPTGPTATLTNVAVTSFSDAATTVPHVNVAWVAPASGMGASFVRYELERQIGTGPWQRIADLTNSATVTFQDREAPRLVASTYRIRAVGIDGRFTNWATTTSVTPTDPRAMLILSSNHDPAEFVHLYEITDSADAETVYPMLSATHDETVAIYGADYQIVFMESEDRGVGWRTRISLKQTTMTTRGLAKFDALTALVRSLDVPYLCVMDHQGNRILGHVSVTEGVQTQPDYRFTALLEITPTHSEPVTVVA